MEYVEMSCKQRGKHVGRYPIQSKLPMTVVQAVATPYRHPPTEVLSL